jgi:hypothetical protein
MNVDVPALRHNHGNDDKAPMRICFRQVESSRYAPAKPMKLQRT